MENKITFTCAICNTSYDSIAERSKCESSCLKKQKEEAKKLEEQKRLENQKTRKAEIELLYKRLNEKVESYIKDYGSLQIGDSRYFNEDNFPSLPKLLGWWF